MISGHDCCVVEHANFSDDGSLNSKWIQLKQLTLAKFAPMQTRWPLENGRKQFFLAFTSCSVASFTFPSLLLLVSGSVSTVFSEAANLSGSKREGFFQYFLLW